MTDFPTDIIHRPRCAGRVGGLRLELRDPTQETPEVRVWLDECAHVMQAEFVRQMTELVAYGITATFIPGTRDALHHAPP